MQGTGRRVPSIHPGCDLQNTPDRRTSPGKSGQTVEGFRFMIRSLKPWPRNRRRPLFYYPRPFYRDAAYEAIVGIKLMVVITEGVPCMMLGYNELCPSENRGRAQYLWAGLFRAVQIGIMPNYIYAPPGRRGCPQQYYKL